MIFLKIKLQISNFIKRGEAMKVSNLNEKGETITLEEVVLDDQIRESLIEILER